MLITKEATYCKVARYWAVQQNQQLHLSSEGLLSGVGRNSTQTRQSPVGPSGLASPPQRPTPTLQLTQVQCFLDMTAVTTPGHNLGASPLLGPQECRLFMLCLQCHEKPETILKAVLVQKRKSITKNTAHFGTVISKSNLDFYKTKMSLRKLTEK